MIHKMRLARLKHIIREVILLEKTDEEDKGGPIDKIKGWQPPSNLRTGSDSTDWSKWDEWDQGGEFDMDDGGLDESDHDEDEE